MPNLLADSGAEVGISGYRANNATLTRTTNTPRTGVAGFRLATTVAATVQLLSTTYLTTGFTAGDQVVLRAYVRARDVSKFASVKVDWHNGQTSGGYMSTGSTSGVQVPVGAWVEISTTLTVPSGAVAALFYVQINGPQVGEVYYVDDMAFDVQSGVSTPPSITVTGPTSSTWPDRIQLSIAGSNFTSVTTTVSQRPTGSVAMVIDPGSTLPYLVPDKATSPYQFTVTATGAGGSVSVVHTTSMRAEAWMKTPSVPVPVKFLLYSETEVAPVLTLTEVAAEVEVAPVLTLTEVAEPDTPEQTSYAPTQVWSFEGSQATAPFGFINVQNGGAATYGPFVHSTPLGNFFTKAARFPIDNGSRWAAAGDPANVRRNELAGSAAMIGTPQIGDRRVYAGSIWIPVGWAAPTVNNTTGSWGYFMQLHGGSGGPPLAIGVTIPSSPAALHLRCELGGSIDLGAIPADRQETINGLLCNKIDWMVSVLHHDVAANGRVSVWVNGVQKANEVARATMKSGNPASLYPKQGFYGHALQDNQSSAQPSFTHYQTGLRWGTSVASVTTPAVTTPSAVESAPAQPTLTSGAQIPSHVWVEDFLDDFDDAAVTAQNWNINRNPYDAMTGWITSGSAAMQAPPPITQLEITGGVAWLKARRESNPSGKPFTACMMTTARPLQSPQSSGPGGTNRPKWSTEPEGTYYVEALLYCKRAAGSWAAFWFLGDTYGADTLDVHGNPVQVTTYERHWEPGVYNTSKSVGWPTGGEIDILEFPDNNVGDMDKPWVSLHWARDHDENATPPYPGSALYREHMGHPDSAVARPELRNSWHRWGCYRSPYLMIFFIDGVEICRFHRYQGGTATAPATSGTRRTYTAWDGGHVPASVEWTKRQHLFLNYSMDNAGSAAGWAGQGWTSTDQFQEGELGVAYVKAWKATEAAPVVTTTAPVLTVTNEVASATSPRQVKHAATPSTVLTSVQVTLDTAPDVGNLLTAHLSVDKGTTGMTISDPSGGTWFALDPIEFASVSGRTWYKIANGNESTITVNVSTARGLRLAVLEHPAKNAVLTAQAHLPATEVSSLGQGPITVSGAGRLVIAHVGIDTYPSGSALTWTGVTQTLLEAGASDSGGVCLATASGLIPAGGTLDVSVGWPATNDQGFLKTAVFSFT